MSWTIPRVAAALAALLLAAPSTADAFTGFYVSDDDRVLVNEATVVVLMREGDRTVVSLRSHYQGPPEDFALVIPVPSVLPEDHVKVLDDEVFDRLHELTAPQLVELWEQDPCTDVPDVADPMGELTRLMRDRPSLPQLQFGGIGLQVTVEASFTTGEYEVQILSADDSAHLETWLRRNGYVLPDGAGPMLRPYVESGMKFFVAKVDASNVRFEDGRARLSPLRFHYDAETFSLPVRLGLLNARGKQDLIIYTLARSQRYEVANYANVTIPTNVDLVEDVRDRFSELYAALIDETLDQNGQAVITELAWPARNCRQCASPTLSEGHLMSLGADVLPGLSALGDSADPGHERARSALTSFVLTRLHTRYDREMLTEDFVFRAASPIAGGREIRSEAGKLERGANDAESNAFRARYVIRHEWKGAIDCDEPIRGRWSGPLAGVEAPPTRLATDTAFVGRGALRLAAAIRTDIPELQIAATPGAPLDIPPEERVTEDEPASPAPVTPTPTTTNGSEGGCASCAATGAPAGGAFFLMLLVGLLRRRR